MTEGDEVRWPAEGALRVHRAPGALPQLGDEPGTNRFDDPRPRTVDRFLMRYAATTLRGCLLELLAPLRPHPTAALREAAVDVDDVDLVSAPDAEPWQHLADFLGGRKVARLSLTQPAIVSIDDPRLQAELDEEPGVRAVLDSEHVRNVLLVVGAKVVHLDNAAIRLASEAGRFITQACALALYDRPEAPGVIHYRSRHDDTEECWAVYDYTQVSFSPEVALTPQVPEHADALRSVAELWSLPLPPTWRGHPESALRRTR